VVIGYTLTNQHLHTIYDQSYIINALPIKVAIYFRKTRTLHGNKPLAKILAFFPNQIYGVH